MELINAVLGTCGALQITQDFDFRRGDLVETKRGHITVRDIATQLPQSSGSADRVVGWAATLPTPSASSSSVEKSLSSAVAEERASSSCSPVSTIGESVGRVTPNDCVLDHDGWGGGRHTGVDAIVDELSD